MDRKSGYQTKEEEKIIKEGLVNSLENDRRIAALKVSFALKGVIIALSVICIALLSIIVWNMLRPKNEITAVVEINSATGEQKYIRGSVSELGNYSVTDQLIMNTIKSYITNLRRVSNDSGINRENIKNVYAFSTGQASSYVSRWVEANNPIDRSANQYVDIVIYNILPINTVSRDYMKFQVDWNEITKNVHSGKIENEKNYRADIDAKQYKSTANTAELNPLGIYICNIIVSEIKDGYVTKPENI